MQTNAILWANNELPTLLDVTCCVRLQTLLVECCCDSVLLGTDATTPNIVGPTMLRVNVFACFCTYIVSFLFRDTVNWSNTPLKVSGCCGRVQSPNDVIDIEEYPQTHTTTQKRTNKGRVRLAVS